MPLMRTLPAFLLAIFPTVAAAGPLKLEAEKLKPGLAAQYRSLVEPAAVLWRIDAKPAFFLGSSSPHPRLPAGPFEVTWNGVIHIQEAGEIAFGARVGGEVSVQVDRVAVVRGQGAVGAAQPLRREPGYYRIAVRYRSLADVPARLQLFWEGPTFAREPIPAWRLSHLPAELPEAARRDDLAEHGKMAAERLGCACCHSSAFPGLSEPPPGPSLADAGRRLARDWLMRWLDDPVKVRSDARMPGLFAADRPGFVERWIIADYLTRGADAKRNDKQGGDHRQGRLAFLSLGCATCHFVPDLDRAEQRNLGRTSLAGLGDRYGSDDLATFLGNPHGRYPDGRMPRLPIAPDAARNIAAYLLLWSRPTESPVVEAPKANEIREAAKRVGARDAASAAAALLNLKGCTACHSGLGRSTPPEVALAEHSGGCLSGKSGPKFMLEAGAREALAAYLAVAAKEGRPSPFAARQRQLQRAGCVRCHQRDSDRPPPIEEIGSTLGGAFLQEIPFMRTPRLTEPHQKYTRAHLLSATRDGTGGLRGPRYSYRMPPFGPDAETLVLALAEGDGESPSGDDPPEQVVADPTLATLVGPALVGSQGYGCISCHVWNGKQLAPADPGAVGPDLTRLRGRIRRDWFDRYLEAPQRSHPGTPMPVIFPRGEPAMLKSVLDGDPTKQKDALWAYFAGGKDAPEPKPAPPVPVAAPAQGEPPLVAQIPIHLPEGGVIESICVLWPSADLLIYDLATGIPHSLRTGGQILRSVQGRTRQFIAAGLVPALDPHTEPALHLIVNGKPEAPSERTFRGYDSLSNGVRLRWQLRFTAGPIEIAETLRLIDRRLLHELDMTGLPANVTVGIAGRTANADKNGTAKLTLEHNVLPARPAPEWKEKPLPDSTPVEGSLERPGYRAIAYPRPKTVSGEDRILPVALAANPRDGRVFVASLKTGELFVLRDPDGTGKSARFDNYGRGLFQDCLSLLAENDALYVLHRRNLTRITDKSDVAEHFDRVALLPHGVADTYDYAYGLVRDRRGGFVYSFAPYANATLRGSGSALSLVTGQPPREFAWGFRNPLGWCVGPKGEVFFTDNQGEWVATNKLCHAAPGRFFGFPNSAQKEHATKPPGRTAVWVPYGWAHSINGVTYDASGGKFGPFAGQFFLAELMFGGAIIRADVEEVNGEYQGACFPFWGKGLLGPVSLTFDPKGRLFVGGITEPGWMAQPDRGALFRIDYTGQMPFEMRTIRVRPHGFRIEFTAPVDPKAAADLASYKLEHYRYEYTGAYGSPELDRTLVALERAKVSADGLSVELTTAPALVPNRVYMVSAPGVRSPKGEALVHTTGAYTLNEVPVGPRR